MDVFRLKRQLLVVSVGVALGAGCRQSPKVQEVEAFTKRMCACEDVQCVRETQKALDAFALENLGAKGSGGDREDILAAFEKIAACAEPFEAEAEAADQSVHVPVVNIKKEL